LAIGYWLLAIGYWLLTTSLSAAYAALSEVVPSFHHKWLFRSDPFYA
jgi:hypothetical protein